MFDRIIGWLIYLFVIGLRKTCTITYEGEDYVAQAKAAHPHQACAFALYHENLFAGIMCHAHRRLAPLASLSKDGDIVTSLLDRLGYYTVRGSSSRGGEKARDDLVTMIEEGWHPTITVDGPRGPRRRVKGGIIDVARRTGVQVVTMTPVADRYWRFTSSWDHFRLPKPWSRIRVIYGPPLQFGPDISGLAFGDAKRKVKERLESGESMAISPD